jgi:ribokinase
MSHPVCVLGSIHMDLAVVAPRFPRAGDSLLGSSFEQIPGGKGANRAVAAARLGGEVELVGAVGDDPHGSELRAVLASEGIGVSGVTTIDGVSTGASVVIVIPGGKNAIIGVPGANDALSAEHVDHAEEAIARSSLLVLHREIPEAAVLRALSIARKAGARVLLHAVPGGPVPGELLRAVDVLVCRERGARLLAGADEDVSPSGLARRLHAQGPGLVVVTRGAEGSVAFDGERKLEQPAFPVDGVDSTGTGAAFVGGLAVSLSEERRLEVGLRFAAAAGALAATRAGGLPSLPTREEVEALLGEG